MEFESDQGNKVFQLVLGSWAWIICSGPVFQFGTMLKNGWLFTLAFAGIKTTLTNGYVQLKVSKYHSVFTTMRRNWGIIIPQYTKTEKFYVTVSI